MNDQSEITTYSIRLRERGQLTIPQPARAALGDKTELLTLAQIGDVLILTPRTPQLPPLADQFAAIMAEEGVTLADLLAEVAAERATIAAERARGS